MLIDEAGRLKATDHYAPWFTNVRSIVRQAEFGPGADQLGYRDPVFAENDEVLANIISVDWTYGGKVDLQDDASIAEFGGIDHSSTSSARFVEQLDGTAEWLRWYHQHPRKLWIKEISNTLRNSDQEAWFAVRKLDRVLVAMQPHGHNAMGDPVPIGPPISQEALVSGVHHTSNGKGQHVMILEFVPLPAELNVWDWGVSAWGETTDWGFGRGRAELV
jgi:hypothetical protein